MKDTVPVLRFAPSPNGRLHLGHAYSAILNAELARKMGGRFLVRIEDIDVTRCTAELTQSCLDDLAWLGLSWERPVRIQSEHFDDYSSALGCLRDRGLIYPCFCTRGEVAERSSRKDPDGAPIYSGTCKALADVDIADKISAGIPHSYRLDMQRALLMLDREDLVYHIFSPLSDEIKSVQADPGRWGDVVLARKETPTSYHLSVVVDDAIQGITHVVRGQDLEAATCLHRLLQALLALPTPVYHHHTLLLTDSGDKLSKSKRHESLDDLRRSGVTPLDIRRMTGLL